MGHLPFTTRWVSAFGDAAVPPGAQQGMNGAKGPLEGTLLSGGGSLTGHRNPQSVGCVNGWA